MAGGEDRLQRQAADVDLVSVGQLRVAQQPRLLLASEALRTLGVIDVPVREEDRADRGTAEAFGDQAPVVGQVRAGVDDHPGGAVADHPGVGAGAGERAGVRRQRAPNRGHAAGR